MKKLNVFILILCFFSYSKFSLADQVAPPQLKTYQREFSQAIEESGSNYKELLKALKGVNPKEKEGVMFLIANMPKRDLMSLKANFLIENVQWAYKAQKEVLWGNKIPKKIFLNYVLPYASLDEHRDNWRKDFYERFINIAKNSKTIDEAVIKLNTKVFKKLQVRYHASKRPKANQSPYESMKAKYASCTGLSILLTDALRAVGIPARIVGIQMWPDGSGNHTWVEIWDGKWKHIGASEATALNKAWFTQKAKSVDPNHSKQHIYATSFKKTSLHFPMAWALHSTSVPADDVTKNYRKS